MKLNELKATKRTRKPQPLYAMERRQNLVPLLGFALVAAFLAVVTLAVYPQMETMLPGMISSLPQEMQEMFLSLMGGESFANFYVMQMGQTWGMVAIIYASYLGYSLVASNFKNNSSTMLYTLNLSRNKIIANKLVRLVINIVLFNVFVGLATLITTLVLGETGFNLWNIGVFTLFMTIASLQLAIILFGICLMNPKKSSQILSILIPVVLFFLSFIGLLDESLNFILYLSPISALFNTTNTILATGFANINYVLVSIWDAIALVLLVVGLVQFNKKDFI